ncbi:hypothetical protein R1flu_025393 [Riccia fluitans]|uniref:DDE Tnp4 domain-containing protein n=1 Tax=Riccia fluitans TaxID=41844 RepID=A0ABD1XXM6_9MARC
MVNYTNRVMTAIECCLKNEISWPNRLERTRIASVFAAGGFPGCIGLVDGTTIRLSQRPAEDGETYFDRKGDYSINAQIISDDRKHIKYFFTGMPGSCHDVTCLRQSSLWKRMHSQQQHLLFDRGQYLLGDSGYTSGERLVAAFRKAGGDKDKTDFNTCIAHHNFLNRRRDDWTEADGPIEVEVESEVQIPDPPTPPLDERAMIARGRRRRLEVQSECLAYMRNGNGH